MRLENTKCIRYFGLVFVRFAKASLHRAHPTVNEFCCDCFLAQSISEWCVCDVAKSGVAIHASVNRNHGSAGDQENRQKQTAENRECVERIAGYGERGCNKEKNAT
jgi:hypothetical protein